MLSTEAQIKKMASPDLVASINALRMAYANGATDYKKAKELAQPYIDELNLRAKYIADRFGKKPQKFEFAGFARNVTLMR